MHPNKEKTNVLLSFFPLFVKNSKHRQEIDFSISRKQKISFNLQNFYLISILNLLEFVSSWRNIDYQ